MSVLFVEFFIYSTSTVRVRESACSMVRRFANLVYPLSGQRVGWRVGLTYGVSQLLVKKVGFQVGFQGLLMPAGSCDCLLLKKVCWRVTNEIFWRVSYHWTILKSIGLTFCQNTPFPNFISSTIWDNFCHRCPKIKLIVNYSRTLCPLSTATNTYFWRASLARC